MTSQNRGTHLTSRLTRILLVELGRKLSIILIHGKRTLATSALLIENAEAVARRAAKTTSFMVEILYTMHRSIVEKYEWPITAELTAVSRCLMHSTNESQEQLP